MLMAILQMLLPHMKRVSQPNPPFLPLLPSFPFIFRFFLKISPLFIKISSPPPSQLFITVIQFFIGPIFFSIFFFLLYIIFKSKSINFQTDNLFTRDRQLYLSLCPIFFSIFFPFVYHRYESIIFQTDILLTIGYCRGTDNSTYPPIF